ncbi:MAG: thiamine-monophosphate kinase [Phycisphaerae bacterium]|nr:thiamine-monophosphate kinase [Phycisphaerae bacterium]
MSEPLSEDTLHRRFGEAGRSLPPEVTLPPGDDLAVVGHDDPILIGSDQVVLGRHVHPDESPYAIGRKAILRNLSDVAAMAARPVATVAAATLGPGHSMEWATELHRGLHETALAWKAPLVGGDLATHAVEDGPTVITVSIVARPATASGRVVTRTGGRPGDLLAVTGTLGGSLESGGGGRHLDFTPRVHEAIALTDAMNENLVAMMDLSDGVARDAGRLASAGTVVARIDIDSVPTTSGCDWRAALTDGEDYELLLACRTPPPPEVMSTPITVIGRLEAPSPGLPAGSVVVGEGETSERIDHLGWEHRQEG